MAKKAEPEEITTTRREDDVRLSRGELTGQAHAAQRGEKSRLLVSGKINGLTGAS